MKVIFEIPDEPTTKTKRKYGHLFKLVKGKYQSKIFKSEAETMQRYKWGSIVDTPKKEVKTTEPEEAKD